MNKSKVAIAILVCAVVSLYFYNSRYGCLDGYCQTGQGTFRWVNGDHYKGQWENGKPNGYGVKVWGKFSDWPGDRYEGEWLNHKRHGKGTYYWPDGGTFEGVYDQSQKVKGKHTYGAESEWAGDWYEGEFANGDRHGQGTYYSAQSDLYYTGGHINGEFYGEGTIKFGEASVKPGFEYVGIWRKGINEEFQKLLNELLSLIHI